MPVTVQFGDLAVGRDEKLEPRDAFRALLEGIHRIVLEFEPGLRCTGVAATTAPERSDKNRAGIFLTSSDERSARIAPLLAPRHRKLTCPSLGGLPWARSFRSSNGQSRSCALALALPKKQMRTCSPLRAAIPTPSFDQHCRPRSDRGADHRGLLDVVTGRWPAILGIDRVAIALVVGVAGVPRRFQHGRAGGTCIRRNG